MQRTESQAEFLHESHGALQTERPFFFPPLKSDSLELLHIHSLSCHILPVPPSLFAPLCDSRGQFPVCVRRPSSQSAVKAVILLVAIYYPVVRLKKDWKWAKPGADCWVSRHTKLQSESTTGLYSLPFCLWKCAFIHRCTYAFSVCAAAHLVERSFICLSCFSQRSRICTLTFFVAAEGWNVLVCKFWR